jgi:sulfate transport system substrate-binding protein
VVAAKHSAMFPKVGMLEIDKDFGGWSAAQKKYFDDGGVFDSIYAGLRRR